MLRMLFKMYIFLWNSSLASGFLYKTGRSHQPEKSGDNYAKHLKKSLVSLKKGMDGITVSVVTLQKPKNFITTGKAGHFI